MIKIQSSYKLIKNKQVKETTEEKSLSNIEYKLTPNAKPLNYEEVKEVKIESEIEEVEDDSLEIDSRAQIEQEIIRDIEDKKNRIISNAEEEAEEIRAKAEKKGFEDGREKGIREGYNTGIEAALEETKILKDNALDLVKQSEEYVADYMKKNEKNIIQLAIDMAESIIELEMANNEESILNLIRPVIREYNKTDKIIITCNSKNYDYLKDKLDELEGITSSDTQFLIFKDNNLGANDCVIETDNQFIDLGIKKQLESIFNTIKHLE